jgi:DNA-binding transcriptional LysR family regulator
MDLEELRAFLSVVETGSFLAAERSLNVPRATLRRRVDSLEARAGVPLLHRNRLGVGPTEAGAVLAARGRLMVLEATALVSSIRELGVEPSGALRVLLPVGLPPQALVTLYAALREAHPRITVEARFSDDPVAGLLDGIDLAVHFGERSPPGPWVSYELVRVREWLVASTEYLARRGTPSTLDDLARHDLLSWAAPSEDPRAWPLLAGGRFVVDPVLIATSVHFLRQCMLAGHGIALLPDGLLPDPGVPSGAVVPLLEGIIGRERAVRLVAPSVLTDLPKIKAVLKHVRAYVEAREETSA